METNVYNQNRLWKYSDLARFLQVSEGKLITATAALLTEKTSLHPYAEINIKVIIHDNKIQRVERTVTEKVQK